MENKDLCLCYGAKMENMGHWEEVGCPYLDDFNGVLHCKKYKKNVESYGYVFRLGKRVQGCDVPLQDRRRPKK